MGAAADPARLRRWRAGRDGHDRAAGRLGRARQHHARRAGRRRPVRAPRPQVVLLLSAVRRVPGACPGPGRALVLPRRARAGRWSSSGSRTSWDALAAVLRGRVPRDRGAPDRGGGTRGAGDHPNGQPHPPGLPARRDDRPAPRHARGDPPCAPSLGVWGAAGRPAGDAQRARRSRDRVRGRDRGGDAGDPQLRRTLRAARSAGSPPR